MAFVPVSQYGILFIDFQSGNFEMTFLTHLGRLASSQRLLLSTALMASTFGLAGCAVTPDPLSEVDIARISQDRFNEAYARQEPVKGAIDLSEAMARAVLYNLDDRVQVAESLLRSRELASASAAMLPSLTSSASRNLRNKVEASSSYNLSSGSNNFNASTSQDERVNTSNAALAWNVLDLGLSYVRANQSADQLLAAEERRRRVLARLVEEVRTAYWRALAADYLSRELPKVEARAHEALEQSRLLIKDGNISPQTALAYQKEIYEIQDRVQSVQTEVVTAKAQLASLMNLPPGTQFTLVHPKAEPTTRPLPNAKSMMASALEYRPEVREAFYQERITSRDQLISILETLPSANLFVNANTTSNSYTLNKEWLGYGAQASWNLMRVFTLPLRQAEAEAKENLAQERARALVSTLALQVAISRDRYAQARRRLQTASDFQNVQNELLEQLRASTMAARSGEQELVREELSALLARARYDVAYAEVQGAWAVVQTTMGRDPYPVLVSNDLHEMKAAFRAKLSGREPPQRRAEGPTAPIQGAPAVVLMAEAPVGTNE